MPYESFYGGRGCLPILLQHGGIRGISPDGKIFILGRYSTVWLDVVLGEGWRE